MNEEISKKDSAQGEEVGVDLEAVSAPITVKFKFTGGGDKVVNIKTNEKETIDQIKQRLRVEGNISDDQKVRLIFKGRMLQDDKTVKDYNIENEFTVHVAISALPPGAAAQTTAAQTAATPAPTVSSLPAVAPTPPLTTPSSPTLATALQQISDASAGVGVARDAISTLQKITNNIYLNPMEEKYRKIKKANAGFQRRVATVPGGLDAIKAMGFQDGGEHWVLEPSEGAWNMLTASRGQLEQALARLPAAAAAPAAAAPAAAAPGLGGMGGGMGAGMGGMGAGMGGMFDPATMQAALQSPQAQAMMRGNPALQQQAAAMMQNPGMMQQAMQMMQQNPGLMQQAQQMMQNPTMMQQMMAGGMPPMPPMGAAGGIPPPPTDSFNQMGGQAPPSNEQQQQQQQIPAEGQQQQSEEEMLAEAIARSLREL